MKSLAKILGLTLAIGLGPLFARAQNIHYSDSTHTRVMNVTRRPIKPVVKKVKIKPITREFSGGVRLCTNGWSIFVEHGNVQSEDTRHSDMFYNIRLWQIELSEIKDPKEYKSTNSNLDPYAGVKSTPFIFGKINNFYSLKFGYGARKMIAGKPDPGTVSIHWVYVGGLALGMLKPYYIKTDNEANPIKYSDSTKGEFLSETDIIGSAGFGQGLGEIKFIPGLHAKTALHFDFAANRKTVMAIETGVSAELYVKKIQLMARHDGVPYFLNFYASFQFGKRW